MCRPYSGLYHLGKLKVPYEHTVHGFNADQHSRSQPGTVPVIVAFHGNGADAAAFALQLPVLVAEAKKRGYIMVFPEGVQKEGSTLRCKERSWNAGSCCDEAVLNDVDDVGAVSLCL